MIGDPQSLNLYTYVRNIPTVNVDTDGHETLNANTNDRGNTRMMPCNTDQCRATDIKISGSILAGFGATLTAGAASGPEAALFARGLLGLGLATAPKTVPLIIGALEGMTPGPSGTLTISAATRLTATEISTGVRLAEQTGTRLMQSEHVGAEFVDAAGKTYDAMGGGKAFEHFGDGSQFLKSITNHLNKAVDFVAVDLKGASKDQVKAIKDFVGGLAKDQQNRIKYVQ